jgi:glycosyltransferase involved in cell wall biosynthesis
VSTPRVSALIPAFNAERYLREAIESALSQTAAAFEVIVLDNGSSDGTAEAARAFGKSVRYSRLPENEGICAARNRCVELARGEYLAFLDADDRWEPDKLERQLAAMRSPARPDLVFGYVRQFVSPELPPAAKERISCPPDPQPGYLVSAMLASRETFERVGRFDTDLQFGFGDFIDWMARARDLGLRELMLDATVLWRRLHDTNHGQRHRDRRGEYAYALKASLDRRRAREAR